jgi:hypothetical protein
MEQGFPGNVPLRGMLVSTIVFHVVMLMLALTAIWGVLRCGYRPAKRSDPWVWIAGCAVAGIGFISALAADARGQIAWVFRPFVFGYILFVGFVCFLGLIFSHRRADRVEHSSHRIALCSLLFLGLLIYAKLPRVPVARDAARQSQCRNNLRQIGLSFENFEDLHGLRPRSAGGDPPVSWRVQMLPFVDGQRLFDQYDQTVAWDHAKNEPVARQQFKPLLCPSDPQITDGRQRVCTGYVMITGKGTVSPGDRVIRRSDFKDGASNTAVVVEAAGLKVVWTEPRDFSVDRQPIGINLKGQKPTESPGMMSSYHRGGGYMLMGDGTVIFVNENIDPRVLRALTTIDGGEKVYER